MATSSKFEPLALLIAAGSSVKAAAHQTGTGERTAYRIAATDAFRQRVSEIRSEIAAATVGELTAAAREAASTLRELVAKGNEPSTRLAAAKAILANLTPMAEHGEMRARLDAIEQGQ